LPIIHSLNPNPEDTIQSENTTKQRSDDEKAEGKNKNALKQRNKKTTIEKLTAKLPIAGRHGDGESTAGKGQQLHT
jgi:hypothetical protein